VTLQGNAASYFTNATNLASGTVADGRLSTNVALLNANQTFTGTMLINTAGTALTVTNTASIGTLTVVASAGIGGSLAVTGGITGASLTVTGAVTAASYAKSCPTGYVPVPSNPKFGTSDFCVMKYEAKNDGSNNAVSTAAGAPYVSISQRTAEDKSTAAGGHLLTEAEWMTIATNALWVNANWCNLDGTSCGNAPGTAGKYLATGHQDSSPNAALAATSDDNDACYGTVTADVSTACGAVGTQKRTLTLSNGSVIWDIPGNVWEWTDSWIIGGDQPTTGTPGFATREYTAITKWQALNYANPTNRGWNTTQRLGNIYSDGTSTNTTLYGFLRGGYWAYGSDAGAFALNLVSTPTGANTSFGFRVAR
jgi:formylglycine-generating enzyme required for sulfatase activity